MKPDQWHLLGNLVERDAPNRENRDSVAAVDGVVAERVGAQHCEVKFTPAYQHDLTIIEDIAFP